jgi:hypothetical protein
MCLFPSSNATCLSYNCTPMVHPTHRALAFRTQLVMLLVIQAVFAVLEFNQSFYLGLKEFCMIMILFLATQQMNHTIMAMYMAVTVLELIIQCAYIGVSIQSGLFPGLFKNAASGFSMIVFILLSIFYIFAIIISFYAYCEFRWMN